MRVREGEKRESQRRRFAPIEFYSSGNRPERVANASRGNRVFVGRLQRLTGLRRSPAKYEFLFRFFTYKEPPATAESVRGGLCLVSFRVEREKQSVFK